MNALLTRWRRCAVLLAAAATTVAAVIAAPAGPVQAQEPACVTVEYQASTWSTGPDTGSFIASITLTNSCDGWINGWTLQLTLAPGHTFSHGWSADWTQLGSSQLTATDLGWNAELAPGGSTNFGFIGNFTGTYQDPLSCTVNGADCGGWQGGNAPPEVTLTSPADGAGIPGVCPVRLAADAADPDGEIDRVEFYVNNVLVGAADTAPYRVDITGSNPALDHGGTNTAFARAFDNGEPPASTDSPAVTFSMAPIPPASLMIACTPSLEVEEGGTATAVLVDACLTPVAEVEVEVQDSSEVTVSPTSYVPNQEGLGDEVTVHAAPDSAGTTASVIASAVVDPGSGIGCLSATVTVTVVAGEPGGSQPPEVALTRPTTNGGYVDGCPARLAAQASATGAIDRVEFYVNGELVGTAHAAPYRAEVPYDHPALDTGGTNVAMARAFDDSTPAGSADSEPVNFFFAVPPPALMFIACVEHPLELVEGTSQVIQFLNYCGEVLEAEVTVTGDAGITASPDSFTFPPGGQVTVSAAAGSAGATATITVAGGSCSVTRSVTVISQP